MTAPLRVAVIGAGGIAQIAHLPILRRLPGVTVVAICDSDLPKARALATRFDVPETYDDIEDVLHDARPDVVALCTPNHLHESHALAALAAGRHVLCERPLALDATGAARVLAAAQRADRRLMVGMNHRFRSDVQAVRAFLADGDLGGVEAIRTGWYAARPGRRPAGWRLRRRQAGGGVLLDLGMPLLDLGLWLAGWPAVRRVSAHLTRQLPDEVESMAAALFVCEGGLSLSLDVSVRHVGEGDRFWFDLVAAKGSATIAPLRVFQEAHGSPVDVTPTGASGREAAFTQSYRAEWTYFLAAVRGEVDAALPNDQVTLLRVVEAAYRSAEQGRDVTP